MTEHLPALQVVIPLLIAPVIFLLNHARTAWLAGVAVSWVSLIISILLLMQVMDGLNKTIGQKKLKLACQDLGRTWKMKQERLSPRSTTRLDEVIMVKV